MKPQPQSSSRRLTAPYILSVCSRLKTENHAFYSLFLNAPQELIGIHLVYDCRTDTGRDEFGGATTCACSSIIGVENTNDSR